MVRGRIWFFGSLFMLICQVEAQNVAELERQAILFIKRNVSTENFRFTCCTFCELKSLFAIFEQLILNSAKLFQLTHSYILYATCILSAN